MFRACLAVIYWGVWIKSAYVQINRSGFFDLEYFTEWGVWLTTIYFTYAFVTHLRYRGKDGTPKDTESIWNAWKWLSALFVTILLWECIIASIYWPVLFPADLEDRLRGKPLKQFSNLFDHAVPVTCLWIDWVLNRIWVEWNQLYQNLFIIAIYGAVNIAVTKVRGTPVYPPISWDSFGAWLIGLSILPLAFAYFTAIYYLTKCKFRKMAMHDAIVYEAAASTMVTSDNVTSSYNPLSQVGTSRE